MRRGAPMGFEKLARRDKRMVCADNKNVEIYKK